MSQFAKLFRNGNSQAVRLPRGFRFSGDKVRIRRSGDCVILEPVIPEPVTISPVIVSLNEWFAKLNSISTDPDFIAQRNQPGTPTREIFE